MKTYMKRLVSLLALSFLVSFGNASLGQESADPTDADPQEAFTKAEIRYAQACLDLAQVDLKIAQKAPNSYSAVALKRLGNNVKVAEEQLRVAKLPPSESDTVPVHLRYLQENARLAKRTHLRALANKKENGFNEAQLEQLRLRAEVAESRLAVWSNPTQVLSYLDHIHWEMDRLGEAVIDLQQRLDKYESK